MFRRTPSGVPSPFPHHTRHPRHEERQQEEDDGVTEGVAHTVVEELHAGLGPEEFRERVQCPIRETEDEAREREPAREEIYMRPDADVAVGDFREQHQQPDEVGERERLLDELKEGGQEWPKIRW